MTCTSCRALPRGLTQHGHREPHCAREQVRHIEQDCRCLPGEPSSATRWPDLTWPLRPLRSRPVRGRGSDCREANPGAPIRLTRSLKPLVLVVFGDSHENERVPGQRRSRAITDRGQILAKTTDFQTFHLSLMARDQAIESPVARRNTGGMTRDPLAQAVRSLSAGFGEPYLKRLLTQAVRHHYAQMNRVCLCPLKA